MATSLLKQGGNVSLTKKALEDGNPLSRVVVACGWDVNEQKRGFFGRGRENDFDLDLSAAGLDHAAHVPQHMDPTDPKYLEWFIYANHRRPSNSSVVFMGDNRTGAGAGDDELIEIDLPGVPGYIETIRFGVVIWRADQRGQTFGEVKNAFIRVYDAHSRQEFARYDLSDFSDQTFVVFGELYRNNGEWKFRAIGQGYSAAEYRAEVGIMHEFETEYARYND